FSPKRRHFHRPAARRTVGLWLAAAGGAGNFRFLLCCSAKRPAKHGSFFELFFYLSFRHFSSFFS
ncbi:MAG: hypothetical protein ACLUFA_05530, partial [[Clostridium] leptum]